MAIVSPAPLQVGQVATCTIEPRKVWRTWRTSPVPLQVAQRTGEVPGSAPLPLQVRADLIAGDLDFFLDPKDGFFEGQLQAVLQVRAAARRVARAPRRAPEPAKAEQVSEDIGKIGEIDVEIRRAARAAHPGVTEAVIGRALFRVGEDGIGFVDLFEALFSIRLLC